MKVSKYNLEGYADPTAFQAMVNIEKGKKAGEKHDNISGKFKKGKKMEKHRDIME